VVDELCSLLDSIARELGHVGLARDLEGEVVSLAESGEVGGTEVDAPGFECPDDGVAVAGVLAVPVPVDDATLRVRAKRWREVESARTCQDKLPLPAQERRSAFLPLPPFQGLLGTKRIVFIPAADCRSRYASFLGDISI